MKTTKILFPVLGLLLIGLATGAALAQELTVDHGATRDEVALTWSGGAPTYRVYRGSDARTLVDPVNEVQATLGNGFTETPPQGQLWFYRVQSTADCLLPTIDAHVRSDLPNSPHGSASLLLVGQLDFTARSYLRFQLDGIPAGARIDEATLWLEQITSDLEPAIELRRSIGPWADTTLTYANQPGWAGLYDVVSHPEGSGIRSLDATSLVQEWVDDTVAEFGLVLHPDGQGPQFEAVYASSESVSAQPPRLCIEWTAPEEVAIEALESNSLTPPYVKFYGDGARTVQAHVQLNTNDPDPVSTALTFLDDYRELFGLDDPRRQLFLDRLKSDSQGYRSWVTFGLQVDGYPVPGQQVMVEVVPFEAFGGSANLEPRRKFAGRQELTAGVAELKARQAVPAQVSTVRGVTSLVWFVPSFHGAPEGEIRLAWRVALTGMDFNDGSGAMWHVYVDAETGDVLLADDMDETGDRPSEDIGIESVNNTTSSGCWWLPGADTTEWFDEDGPTGYPGPGSDAFLDGSLASAMAHRTYHYYYDTFGRRGYNGSGGKTVAKIHVGAGNASWRKWCNFMLFADGWVTADVLAHEFTHGVIRDEGGMRYNGEPGALNESYADLFGVMVDPDNDWQMGEDRLGGGASPVRDMQNPIGSDPDHYDDRCTRTNDYCNFEGDKGGVHTNSSITNKVAYLLGAGDSHNGFAIGALGLTKLERLWYDTLVHRLTNSTTLHQFRDEVYRQAQSFVVAGSYGFTFNDVCQVLNAFASVGLGDPDTDCDGAPNAPTDDGDGDGIPDGLDNCPLNPNRFQGDRDGDGIGDACEIDRDGDGLLNDVDNCPDQPNPDQFDTDSNGRGDVCDDSDDDGVMFADDNCPDDYNPWQENMDGDSFGDICDGNIDGDGWANGSDNCDSVWQSDQTNSDGDAWGDACDNCDFDDNPEQEDGDEDEIGDVCDDDVDGDGHDNDSDNCPDTANADQLDNDGDGLGLLCDSTELEDLDGIRLASELSVFFNMPPPGAITRFPIFPCRDFTCPDSQPAVNPVNVAVETDQAYMIRVVDDLGNVLDLDGHLAAGVSEVRFPGAAEYFYRFPQNGGVFKGRQYFLEMMAPPGAQGGTVTGKIRVRSADQAPQLP